MAKRPVFIPVIDGDHLVKQEMIDFTWFPGFSVKQKQKSIESFHNNAKDKNISPLLEISTKSLDNLGKNLSAFNLKIRLSDDSLISVESAYQGSKVFENGGPYRDLFSRNGFIIKKDPRLQESGRLVKFYFEDEDWSLNPTTAFYDWLYIKALFQNDTLSNLLSGYFGFTDIEFNPEKSFSCQARTAALFVALSKRNLIREIIENKDVYLNILSDYHNIFANKDSKNENTNDSLSLFN